MTQNTAHGGDGLGRAGAPLWMTIAERIRDEIMAGALEAGTRLVEADIAARFDVSQATVRSAFAQLVHEQFLDKRPRRGTYVAEMTVDESTDLQDIRLVLEPYAVSLVCALDDEPRATIVERLDETIERMHGAAVTRSAENNIQAQRDFHRVLFESADNAFLGRIWDMLDGSPRNAMALTRLVKNVDFTPAADSHVAIRDAIAAGDSALAQRLVTERITFVRGWMKAALVRDDSAQPGRAGSA